MFVKCEGCGASFDEETASGEWEEEEEEDGRIKCVDKGTAKLSNVGKGSSSGEGAILSMRLLS
jgi:hypothetical protein